MNYYFHQIQLKGLIKIFPQSIEMKYVTTVLGDLPGLVSKKYPCFFFGFCRKLMPQKTNKAQKKRANITGVQYYCRIWY